MCPRPGGCILFAVMVISWSSTCANYCLRDGVVNAGVHLTNALVKTIPNLSVYDCAGRCVQFTVCASFNYQEATRVCELNYAVEVAGVYSLEPKAGSIYSDISNWPKAIAGPCRDHTCKADERCDVSVLNTASCVANPDFSRKYVLSPNAPRMNWTAAVDECNRLYGKLAIVKDEQSYTKVKDAITSEGFMSYAWLGASRDTAGVWRWIDDQDVTFYKWTTSGQPVSIATHNCLTAIYLTSTISDWFNRECDAELRYVCEFVATA